MIDQRAIAEQILGAPIDADGYAPCPGAHLHTTSTGAKDFRIFFDPTGETKPHEHCFHASCAEARADFMSRLWAALAAAERGENPTPKPAHYSPAAIPPKKIRPALDHALAKKIASRIPDAVDESYLIARSPVDIPTDRAQWAELLIDTLYPPGSRILIFTKFASQGQFLRVAGQKNYKLAAIPGQQARPITSLPSAGDDGVWFLAAPITGKWLPKPGEEAASTPKLSRRSQNCCTAYPYAVIESDVIPPATWLKILVQLRDPIAAIYTSGGKSIHALIALGDDCTTPAQFNHRREELRRRLTPVGADPAAITAVRLTRLPGALRLSKRGADGQPNLQKLLYLNPCPQIPICRMPLMYQ